MCVHIVRVCVCSHNVVCVGNLCGVVVCVIFTSTRTYWYWYQYFVGCVCCVLCGGVFFALGVVGGVWCVWFVFERECGGESCVFCCASCLLFSKISVFIL